MTRFLIAPDVASLLPRMQVVVVTTSTALDNHPPNGHVAAFAQATADAVLVAASAAGHANAQSHPRVALYRDELKRTVGVSAKKYPQSHEALLKRLLKDRRPARPISPVVDMYNSVSLAHLVTAGAFDLAELRRRAAEGGGGAAGPLELRLARADDRFLALDAAAGAEPVRVDEREFVYAQGGNVLTRHLAWRQSASALVGEDSTEVVFVSEVLHHSDVGQEPSRLARTVADELVGRLRECFGVEAKVAFLGESLGQLEVDL